MWKDRIELSTVQFCGETEVAVLRVASVLSSLPFSKQNRSRLKLLIGTAWLSFHSNWTVDPTWKVSKPYWVQRTSAVTVAGVEERIRPRSTVGTMLVSHLTGIDGRVLIP